MYADTTITFIYHKEEYPENYRNQKKSLSSQKRNGKAGLMRQVMKVTPSNYKGSNYVFLSE